MSATERVAEVAERVMRESGLSDRPWEYDSSIHSWRCEHPDRYGECECFADMAREIAEQVAPLIEQTVADALGPVEALADEWASEGPLLVRNAYSGGDVFEGQQLERCAHDLRAAVRAGREGAQS